MNEKKIYSILDNAINEISNELESDTSYDFKSMETQIGMIYNLTDTVNRKTELLYNNYINRCRNVCPLAKDICKVDAVLEYHEGCFDYDMICDILGYNPSKLIFAADSFDSGWGLEHLCVYDATNPFITPNLSNWSGDQYDALCIWIEK